MSRNGSAGCSTGDIDGMRAARSEQLGDVAWRWWDSGSVIDTVTCLGAKAPPSGLPAISAASRGGRSAAVSRRRRMSPAGWRLAKAAPTSDLPALRGRCQARGRPQRERLFTRHRLRPIRRLRRQDLLHRRRPVRFRRPSLAPAARHATRHCRRSLPTCVAPSIRSLICTLALARARRRPG